MTALRFAWNCSDKQFRDKAEEKGTTNNNQDIGLPGK